MTAIHVFISLSLMGYIKTADREATKVALCVLNPGLKAPGTQADLEAAQ